VQGADQTAYADKLSGAEFIEFIRKRLILARELLADDGSIFVHLDNKMAHYIKLIMDEIFGKNNFKNEIVWHYKSFHGQVKSYFPRKHDTIFFYTKTDNNIFYLPRKDIAIENMIDYKNWGKYIVNGDEIRGDNYPKDVRFKRNLDKWMKEHPHQTPTKDDVLYVFKSQPEDSVWDINYIDPKDTMEKVGYPTQKPEELLERIIKATTNENDIVLDFFAGSGTTPAVAERLNRRWIAIDVGKYAIYTMQKRLLKIVEETKRPFVLYSGGLYDAEKLNKFDSENWKLFALQLWGCEVNKKKIKGLDFDGKKDNNWVKVYSPQELKENGSKISIETIKEIDEIIGSNAGSEIFIIAPQGQFDFAEDDLEIGDRTYHTLRVPYSLLAKFTENFTPPAQPKDSGSVNAIVDAVGFDFIQPPFVRFEVKDNYLYINEFRSNSRLKGEQKTELSMVFVDYDYNGEVFDIDAVFYNKDLYEKNKLKDKIAIDKIENKAMFIFVDNAGNEFKKEVIANGK
jgi:site-specific DNA-methyltransferase (adenine-specific)/adenine-specific DNA-methyltransferase